jgi:hypothetical protein
MSVDMTYKGKDAWGSINSGGKLQLESIGGETYLKAEDAFWKSTLGTEANAAIALINGRWLKVDPHDSNFGSFDSFADKKAFISQLLSPAGTVTKGGTSKINGVNVVALVDSSKDGGTLYIDTATGRPVQIVPSGVTTDTGSINFSYEDPGAAPTAPAAGEVLDSAKLSGGASASS